MERKCWRKGCPVNLAEIAKLFSGRDFKNHGSSYGISRHFHAPDRHPVFAAAAGLLADRRSRDVRG
jgi:hypothetical protein